MPTVQRRCDHEQLPAVLIQTVRRFKLYTSWQSFSVSFLGASARDARSSSITEESSRFWTGESPIPYGSILVNVLFLFFLVIVRVEIIKRVQKRRQKRALIVIGTCASSCWARGGGSSGFIRNLIGNHPVSFNRWDIRGVGSVACKPGPQPQP